MARIIRKPCPPYSSCKNLLSQVLDIAITCEASASGALQPWKWCLIGTGYSSLVRRKLSSAHSPRNGLDLDPQMLPAGILRPEPLTNHARPLPRNLYLIMD